MRYKLVIRFPAALDFVTVNNELSGINRPHNASPRLCTLILFLSKARFHSNRHLKRNNLKILCWKQREVSYNSVHLLSSTPQAPIRENFAGSY